MTPAECWTRHPSSSRRPPSKVRGSRSPRRSRTAAPSIAYDVPYGPREILARGGGWLIPDGDEDMLARMLVRLLTEIEVRAQLAEEAVQVARAR